MVGVRASGDPGPRLCLRGGVQAPVMVRPDVAQRRKPDMQLQELEKRAEAIRSLRFPDVTETVDIDAEEPLEQVVRRIRRCIWRKI